MINATPQLNDKGVIIDTNHTRNAELKNDNKPNNKIIINMSFPPLNNLNKHLLNN